MALLLLLLTLLLATPAQGQQCVLLQSSLLKPYEEASQGFEKAWQTQRRPFSGPKSITPDTVAQVLLSEQQPKNNFSLQEQLQTAGLVVAIGDPALNFVRDLRGTPVLYLLAPSAGKLPANFTGIDLRITPSRQLEAIRRLMPKLRTIGALYNPKQTGHWVQEALLSPVDADQTLQLKKVSSPAEVPEALASLRNSIDAYWLLPDELVTSPQALTTLREFSMANRIPIMSFSEKYLKAGAAAAITFSMADMGDQAAAMAARILAGTLPNDIPVESPRRLKVIANITVLRRIGVPINEAAIDQIYSGETQP
jgi:putative ABC transport system substrate-binding protein